MVSYRGYKTELQPNRAQQVLLAKHCGAARFAYNWGLARRNEEYLRSGRVLTSIDLHRELNQLKKTSYPWLYEVSKCAPHEALRDLDIAFRMFFAARKKGSLWPRFPKFKKRKEDTGSFRLNGVIRVGPDWIQLPRLGRIRLKERNYIPAKPAHLLSATVTQRAGHWFVAVRVLESRVATSVDGPVIGIDLGLERLAVTSEGEVFANPRTLKRNARKLRRLNRRHQRRVIGSNRRRRARRHLARLHLHLSNIRSDNLHKITTRLAKTKSVIVIEDLPVLELQRSHRVSRGLADAALGRLRVLLSYKTAWYGSRLVVARRMYPSSQRCSQCGFVNSGLRLADRTFLCPRCGVTIDRDLNAARNLAAVAESSSETQNARGAESSGRSQPVKLSASKRELQRTAENGKVIGVSSFRHV